MWASIEIAGTYGMCGLPYTQSAYHSYAIYLFGMILVVETEIVIQITTPIIKMSAIVNKLYLIFMQFGICIASMGSHYCMSEHKIYRCFRVGSKLNALKLAKQIQTIDLSISFKMPINQSLIERFKYKFASCWSRFRIYTSP